MKKERIFLLIRTTLFIIPAIISVTGWILGDRQLNILGIMLLFPFSIFIIIVPPKRYEWRKKKKAERNDLEE